MTELLTIADLCAWLKLTEFQVRSMLRKRGQARMTASAAVDTSEFQCPICPR